MPDSMTKAASNHASFAVPRAAIDALIDAKADAVTIGAYLTLACHTDKSGKFSTVGLKAIRENLVINRARAEKAIDALCTIGGRIAPPEVISTPTPRSKRKRLQPQTPTIPLIHTRDTWIKDNGVNPPDGPNDRSLVRHILPTFEEPLEQRVWISNGLVSGDAVIEKPLRELKNCGDIAARLLLAMYAGQDINRWYGLPPHGFPWNYYAQGEGSLGQFRIVYASESSMVGPTSIFSRIDPQYGETSTPCFAAARALQSAGFIYESVVLLNRNPVPAKFASGEAYGEIPHDAEILCDLAIPSPFGPVSIIEEGLGKDYSDTVNQLAKQQGYADAHVYLTALSKKYDHYDYLALVPTGQPAMIAGLYRLRFRVTNTKNAFVEEASRRHLDANAAAIKKLNYLRKTKNLEPITRTLQSPSIPFQSSSIMFNTIQCQDA